MEKDNKYKGIITILALVIVAMVAYNLGSNNSGTGNAIAPTGGGNVAAPTPSADIKLNSNDHILGDPNAPVTIIEYSDFECPFCGRFYGGALGSIKSEYVDTGKAKFVYRHLPLTQIHSSAQKAAEASECAADQGQFWEYHNMLFDNQQDLSIGNLKQHAVTLGLDSTQFDSCLDSGEKASRVNSDISSARSFGVGGTPGTFVEGKLISGAQPFGVFQQAIEAEL